MANIHDADEIILRLREAGHEAYLVGGCVRDHLIGASIKDIDVATSATPDQVAQIFGSAKFVGQSFGVSMVSTKEGAQIEVATYRKDGTYMDGRHPESVSYGTIEEDARRRDFTINALYMDPIDGRVIDLVGGLQDLRNRVIRAVGDPINRISEDPLRMLRAVRFACRLGYYLHPSTEHAIKICAHRIKTVSGERQRDEITAMLMQDGIKSAHAMYELGSLGLLKHILPEVDDLKIIVDQGQNHPEGCAYEHTMLVVRNLYRRTPVLVWAALLHDIGKISTYSQTDDGEIHFYEHERVGAEMAEAVFERLRFSRSDADAIREIIYRHMTPFGALQWARKTMRRFCGDEHYEDIMTLHRADILGSSGNMESYDHITGTSAELGNADVPVMPEPLLTGRDLIAMGYKPGPMFGRILAALQDEQLEDRITTREQACDYVWAQDWTPIAKDGQ